MACDGPINPPPSIEITNSFFCHWVNLSNTRCLYYLAVGDLCHVRPWDCHKCRKVLVISIEVLEINVSIRQKLVLNCYAGADFARLWGHEDPQDPICARSKTEFVVTFANCPLL